MKVRLEPSPLSCLVRRIKRVGVARAHNLLNWWPKATCSADRHIFYLLQGYSKSYLRGGLKLLRRWESEREKRWIDLSTHAGYIYENNNNTSQLYSVTDVTDGGLRHTHLYRSIPRIIYNIIRHRVALQRDPASDILSSGYPLRPGRLPMGRLPPGSTLPLAKYPVGYASKFGGEFFQKNSRPRLALNFRSLTTPRFFVNKSAGLSSPGMKYTSTRPSAITFLMKW
jgi:hypothetical protein